MSEKEKDRAKTELSNDKLETVMGGQGNQVLINGRPTWVCAKCGQPLKTHEVERGLCSKCV